MNPDLHPNVFSYLNDMGVQYLLDPHHRAFVHRLERVNDLCERAGGQLKAKQVLAMMVEQYEREEWEKTWNDE